MLAKGIQIKPKTQILEKTKLITTRYSDPVRSLFVLYEAAPGQKSGTTLITQIPYTDKTGHQPFFSACPEN